MTRIASLGLALLVIAAAPPQAPMDPTLAPIIAKLGEYVASYGRKASVLVAVEKYTQSVTLEGTTAVPKPRTLVAEFAIVKATGGSWVGYRDVVEVNGEKIGDRRDRLQTLLTGENADVDQATKIANESARYNVGPISRNFNTPTAAMFFFDPSNLSRFTFTKKGDKKIDGTPAVEIEFKESKTPSLIRTRAGKDVPLEGTLWVVPADGTVVRTRLRLRNFADSVTSPTQSAPSQRTAVNPNTPTGGREALAASASGQALDMTPIDSTADIDVNYKMNESLGLWLPAKMSELYEGPIALTGRAPSTGRSTTQATYADFKQFGTSATITVK